jgi:hypothetical protein
MVAIKIISELEGKQGNNPEQNTTDLNKIIWKVEQLYRNLILSWTRQEDWGVGGRSTSFLRDHLQIIRSKSETKWNGFSALFDFKIHSTIWNDLSVTETFLRVNEYP